MRAPGQWISIGALLLASACAAPSGPGAAVDVVAADGALCDITRRLAGPQLTVRCLLRPSDDPHQFQLSPQQSREIRQAQLVLINGYGLTPALEKLPSALAVAELAVPHSPRDPHVWHDPRQAAALVAVVSRRLQRLDPAAAGPIQNRAEAMRASLAALDGWNRTQFASIPGPRTLASDHRAFTSLARAYQLQELPVVDSTSSSERMRPQGFNAVVQRLRRQRPASLFSEQSPPSRSLERVSALSGVPIAPQPLRGDAVGDNLMATLTANTCLIVDQLKGRCDSASGAQLVARWRAIR